jgi:hypothetical protein
MGTKGVSFVIILFLIYFKFIAGVAADKPLFLKNIAIFCLLKEAILIIYYFLFNYK